MERPLRVSLAVLALVAASGCDGQLVVEGTTERVPVPAVAPSPVSTSATPTAPSGLSPTPVTFPDGEAVLDRLRADGFACSDVAPASDVTGFAGLVDAAACTYSGDPLTAAIFTDKAAARSTANALSDVDPLVAPMVLLGFNWIVWHPDASVIIQVQETLRVGQII